MKTVRSWLAICLAVLIMAPAVNAQTHVIGKTALDKAVQDRGHREQSDREAIIALLHRADVRDLAANAGLSLEKAEAAVYTLHGNDLQQIASNARQVQNNLAGGASTIVISTTTVILVLLIVILVLLVR